MLHRIDNLCKADPVQPFGFEAEPAARHATIVVIDHDAAVRDALSVTLSAHGMDVLTYRSAGAFLRTSPPREPGCLLVEFDLADMSGMMLIDHLRAEEIILPAIIMSARLRLPIPEKKLPFGVTALLQKPFGQDELMEGLRYALDRP